MALKPQSSSPFGHHPHGGTWLLRTPSICLFMLWIGYGFSGMTLTFSSRVKPQIAVQLRHPIGNSWLSASTSLSSRPPSNSPSGTVAFKKVVIPALATIGVGINSVPPSSGWSTKNINLKWSYRSNPRRWVTIFRFGSCGKFNIKRFCWALECVRLLVQ